METQNRRFYGSLSTFQWFIFLLANSVALPIVIGGIFHLSIEEVSALMQRTFLVVGLSSFIQGWLGHRYPIADGPAGSWVSVFVILADVAVRQGQSLKETLQILEGGFLIAGLLLLILGLSGYFHRLLFLFTPLVTGSFLLILALQLSGVFMKGMIALQGESSLPDYGTAAISFGVFILVILLSVKGKGWIKNYAVLIGILSGWLLYTLLGKSSASVSTNESWVKLPELFAWGNPHFNAGIVITAILFTFILVSNTIAAVSAVSQVVPEAPGKLKETLNRGGIAGGISHFLCAVFSTIGVVPLPVSAGFIRLTEQTRVRPFLVACLALSGISLVPVIVNFLALLPGPIATAALLASFVQMIGIAFQSILRETLDQRRLTILGITLLISIGLMFLPPTAFQGLPSILQYVFSNGLLVGTMIVILLEQLWKADKA
ncbi:purine/pyrimidine permease [Paenibacillus chondroitinus]|uniref:Purine/pyrimidine permease n=1 Tax=Paenibacillus chondroitinus TaxID=59842 RepID=A0ABU6DCS1_9BACL|nr:MULTISPECIES: purine/pyrimidine permease [Paenibacillus]MCY9662229.1 purine/pyrimidine permease [Paenibacillus anseongense]MEB4794733.1 purine/pyrimidine permease [Paenibacillus chondroitinus]